MCRLFGSRSQEPERAARELVRAENALRVQSVAHPDGWGIGWYTNDSPHVVRSVEPAHADLRFEQESELLHAQTVIAHVRKASIGRIALENTHPFQFGRWLFVHNGTIPNWERASAVIEEEIEPSVRRALVGETDSERCAALFFSQLARRCDPENAPFLETVEALKQTVALVRAASEPGAQEAASTTFLLTDGRTMIACRRGRTLHACAPAPGADGRVAWLALSSEHPHGTESSGAIGQRGSWIPLEEDSWIGIDAELRLHGGALVLGA
jgi:glutamine amidotransferase